MHKLTQAILVIFAAVSTASLYSIEQHASLGALALATMAVERGVTPRRQAPGVQRSALSTPRVRVSAVDEAPAPEGPPPRFEQGQVEMPDGSKLVVIEDKEARTVVYMVKDEHGVTLAAVHIPLNERVRCEGGDALRDSGLLAAREIR